MDKLWTILKSKVVLTGLLTAVALGIGWSIAPDQMAAIVETLSSLVPEAALENVDNVSQ